MSKNNDSIQKTLIVVVSLCLVCSLVVSIAAVGLKPLQIENKALDKQRNILEAAGLLEDAGKDIKGAFAQYIEARVVDLASGEYVNDIDALKYDQRKASKDPKLSVKLDPAVDYASIKRVAKNVVVYLAKNAEGEVESIILPVHGYGLWSTMYAFLAVTPDTKQVKALVYYDQAETPGLGAEVENPRWKAQWVGKRLFDENWNPVIDVVKGKAPAGSDYQIDGLSGATLTANGVQFTMDYWLSEHGFGPYLAKVRSGGLNNG